MLRLFSSILDWLQSLLNIFVDKPSANGKDTTSRSETSEIEVVEKIPKKPSPPEKENRVPAWGNFIKTFVPDRWSWIKRHPIPVIIILALVGIAFFSEGSGTPWWITFWETIKSWWVYIWNSHPITVVLVGIVLFLLLFGLDWLRQIDNWMLRLLQWATSHRQISTTLGVILAILVFYIISNANTWAFTSVEVWEEDKLGHGSDEIAIQFRGNLNAIGTSSFETLTISVPNPPAIVTQAKSNLTPLTLDDCAQIMIGPKSFVALAGHSPVSLPRLSRAQADNGTAGQISLGTTLGNFNLPLQGLFRLIFSVTSPNYRELSAQIVPASRTSEADAVRIIVTAIDGQRWAVEGSKENLPQLINFLTYQIALDWKFQRTEQATDKIESADLALALGNRAFTAGDFKAALAYYRLAEWFRADSVIIEIMLGLTQLQLSKNAPTDIEKQQLLDKASRAFNQAATLEPTNVDLFPYLACLYQQTDNTKIAVLKIEAFNDTISPNSPDAKQERITELDKKPPLGPGRRLSVRPREDGFDLYYISDDAASFALNMPYEGDLENQIYTTITTGEAPRQIFAVDNGAYYLTADGLVNLFLPGDPPIIIPVVDANSLQFSIAPDGVLSLGASADEESNLNMGGIRQIFAQGNQLFLADRFGRILRLNITETGTGGLDVILEAVTDAGARQIYLDSNTLYVLKEDGTVWRISDPRTGDLKAARQLVTDTDNREITAANGVVYMLRTNGNIWRYLDGEGIEGDLLKRIDGGGETNRIFITPQGLFVLKNSGATWLIQNPQNPTQNDIEQLNLPTANRAALNAITANIITLERNESGSPIIKNYPDLLQTSLTPADQMAQMQVEQQLLPTAIPLSTPTPAPPIATPTNTPLPTNTPTPLPTFTATPALETEIEAYKVISQTRLIDDAVEVLIYNQNQANQLTQPDQFWMDQTEVTEERYQICVEVDEVCEPNQTGYADLFYRESHPVVGVTWQQAQTYCEWAGGSLPTISQWRAAASPDGRDYPWGDNSPTCQLAVINDSCDGGDLGTRMVGSKPQGISPHGVLDLIGNVWEWTLTVGNKDDARATIGGSWSNPDGTNEGGFEAFNPSNIISQGEERQSENLGFRCVRPYQQGIRQ